MSLPPSRPEPLGRVWGSGTPPGLVRLTSAQLAADAIRRMIFEGALRSGDRLRQDELAAQLGVSRIPVREAVIILDREGWVRSRPHRGAYVNGLDEHSVRDHYAMLGLMFGICARRAAERGSAADVQRLVELHRELQAEREPDRFWLANNAFQRGLLASARSRRIMAIARMMLSAIIPGNFFAEVPGAMRVHRRGMRAVVSALRAGDGAGAEHAFTVLLSGEADAVVSLLAVRGLLETDPVDAEQG